MNLILFDDRSRDHLLPLTFTRPIAELRIGILTIREKWENRGSFQTSFLTENYLAEKFPLHRESENVLIAGSVCPDDPFVEAVRNLQKGEALVKNNRLLAARDSDNSLSLDLPHYKSIQYEYPVIQLNKLSDLFVFNERELNLDFQLLTKGRSSQKIDSTNTVLGDQLFVEEGATASCSVFNSKTGPIYLGKNSEVWEGSFIRGGFALCEGSSVKMGAKIYGATTIGPFSRVGGEVSNSLIQGYSNKGHDGFLGNSVLGEWCNIGADSNNSNLKNNYAEVKLWDYAVKNYVGTGLQFCGLIMGDHSKCGINTMFNTGTVVGVSANIYGAGFPPNFIPSFSWGSAEGFETYQLDKLLSTAERVFDRRSVSFDQIEKNILTHLFNNPI
jgi:UDP-N-acetylglucosamine diphosphorylase/glucosamine-1-phosphate N-acetyltransferase